MEKEFIVSLAALLIAAGSFLLSLNIFVTPAGLDSKLKNIYDRLENYQSKDACKSKHDGIDAAIQEILSRLRQITDYMLGGH